MGELKFKPGDVVRLTKTHFPLGGYWPKAAAGGRWRVLEEAKHGGHRALKIEPINGSPMPNLKAGDPIVEWFVKDEFLTAVSRAKQRHAK